MNTLTIGEHETASISEAPGDSGLTVAEAIGLDRAQRAVGVEAFSWSGRNQIRAAQYVGMIATASARLEILPKIGQEDGEIRRALIRMIGIAWDVKVWDGEITGHDYQNRDLLELLIGLFARRLQKEIRLGLSRAYRAHEGDLSLLRGKLDVTRQFTKLALCPQKLACRYDEFTADTALNRLLLCATTFLRRRSAHADTQRLLNEIAAQFDDVSIESPSAALAETPILDRIDRRWNIPAKLARLLLAKVYQTAHSGKHDGIAIMFDMNRLFEAYVAAVARRVCASLGYEIVVQGPRGCLAKDSMGQDAFRTRPDLHVERPGKGTVVLDTKWKHVDPSRPDFDIAQADAEQMHGYAHVYKAHSTILLYPHHPGFKGQAGVQARWHFEAARADLILATIDIAKLQDSDYTIRRLLEEG